jgi:DNA replication protein DnaD
MNKTANNIGINSKGYFTVHHFMTKVLGLGGAKLLVYALIYSFTVNDGSFFGSRGYIAEACGTSVKTVDRALKELVNNGLLSKGEATHLESIEYKANISPQTEGESQNDAPSKKSQPLSQKVVPLRSECLSGGVKVTHNNKDYTKTTTTTTTTTAFTLTREDTEESEGF